MKLKKDDEVIIVAGKDKGRKGKIEKVFPKEGKVLILGVNLYKRHLKKREKQEGGIIELSRPLPAENVQLVCPQCGKATRVSYKISGSDRSRVCKKCDQVL